jgi:hypothetical protein
MRVLKIYYLPIILLILCSCNRNNPISNFSSVDNFPVITPDYVNVVIPPNIAPLNFYINEKAEKYQVEISSKNGKPIIINQTSASIQIPENRWHKLISENKGNTLNINVFLKNMKWTKYKTIVDSVVNDSIDKFLVYRLINGAYILWEKMGIYQRNIETFDQSAIFENTSFNNACVNCHMFCKNDPQNMQLHLRGPKGGTLILKDNALQKINTKVTRTVGACAYPSWHPGGNIIAYSVNVINQNMTSDHTETQFVFDKVSDIVLYNIKTNTLQSYPELRTKNRENLPTWSPDGKTMYYISAPEFRDDPVNKINEKYDLVSITYDETTNTFGTPDTLLRSSETGLSITFPVVSPDGKFILLGMANHGYFPVYNASCDIYIYDIAKRTYMKAPFNSPSADSYHSWSSSGRWIAFSSKRLDNTYSRTFFTYFDKNGNSYKPFVLPQKDPLFYDKNMENFNRPELIKGKVPLRAIEFRDFANCDSKNVLYKE